MNIRYTHINFCNEFYLQAGKNVELYTWQGQETGWLPIPDTYRVLSNTKNIIKINGVSILILILYGIKETKKNIHTAAIKMFYSH